MKIMQLMALVCALTFSSAMAADEKPYKMIDADALQSLQQTDKNLVIIDSRSQKYLEDGIIIKGAKLISAKETDTSSLATIAPDPTTTLVFYCTNLTCPASSIAAVKAAHAGYKHLYKYAGGIEDWKSRNLPTETIKKN